MEFKKPNKYGKERPMQHGSHPRDLTLAYPRPIPRPAPPLRTAPPIEQAPPHIKDTENKPDRISLRAVAKSYVKQSLHNRKTLIALLVIVVLLIIAGIFVAEHNMTNNTDGAETSHKAVDSLEYQTILPDGKSIGQLGGWKRVSPTDSDPVYAYTDTIGSISINVSEQPLPKSFIGDTDDQVSELAKKFSATNKVSAGDIKVYVGTSSKGPQSVIFTKNSLLVLIKSQEKITDDEWAQYIQSLN